MEEYTREQIQRADDTDLYVFLSGRGESFKRCGKEYRWLRHDSVMINKNEWYRFSQNKGGHAIDFMKEFYGLSFAEADRRSAPSPCLDWNCQKEMKAVRLQGSISLNRENYRNIWWIR